MKNRRFAPVAASFLLVAAFGLFLSGCAKGTDAASATAAPTGLGTPPPPPDGNPVGLGLTATNMSMSASQSAKADASACFTSSTTCNIEIHYLSSPAPGPLPTCPSGSYCVTFTSTGSTVAQTRSYDDDGKWHPSTSSNHQLSQLSGVLIATPADLKKHR